MRPDAIAALRRLEGTLDEKRMIRLNAEAERTKNYTRAADLYFEGGTALRLRAARRPYHHFGESFPHKLVRWTLRHLQLAGFSLLLSIVFGIPLGIVASRGGPIGHAILGFASVVQTIPSLALLALLVPFPSSESARAPRSRRFFFTGCSRSCGTPQAACRTFRDRCANRRLRWDSAQ